MVKYHREGGLVSNVQGNVKHFQEYSHSDSLGEAFVSYLSFASNSLQVPPIAAATNQELIFNVLIDYRLTIDEVDEVDLSQ